MKVMTLVGAFLVLTANEALGQYMVVGSAQPVLGLGNERLTYISPNADYMLVTIGTFPTYYTASRTWDSVTRSWGPLNDNVIGGFSVAATLSNDPDGQKIYYQRPVGGVSVMFRATWDGTKAGNDEERLDSLTPVDASLPVLTNKRIVYSAYNGATGWDSFTATRDAGRPQGFAPPTVIPAPVNTIYNDVTPWISNDDIVLSFCCGKFSTGRMPAGLA